MSCSSSKPICTKFKIGQVVHHKTSDYRAIVYDIDCEVHTMKPASAKHKPEPWYYLLVHAQTHTSVVAEHLLEADASNRPIEHPMLNNFFETLSNGHYRLRGRKH